MMTPKQVRFVEEYLKDPNAARAAERAGYSKKTAFSAGSRLLKHVEIAALIVKKQMARSDRTDITADRVLTELALVAFADVLVESRIRVGDKVKALELMGRHLAMWKDRIVSEEVEPLKIEVTHRHAAASHAE